MYSVKEKLRILREIHNPAAVQADLALFRTASPDDSRLVKFNLMPERHAEEILFSLLDRFTREEIIANRRTFFNHQQSAGVAAADAPEEQNTESASEPKESAEESAGVAAADAPEEQDTESASEPKESAEQSAGESKKKSAKTRSTRA